MGCIKSKVKCDNVNSRNRFDVIFADTDDSVYYNSQLEINGNDIILYRKNRAPICWSIGCLRRYGYDANFFTFEAGRRAERPGIFSFKCQRADVLFNTLQSYINGRAYNTDDPNLHDFAVPNASNRNIAQLNSLNLGGGTLHTGIQGSSYIVNARPNSSLSPAGTNSIQSRSTDTLTADYLEPNPSRPITSHVARFSSSNRMSSFGSEGPSSPASPNSYTNILEITNLNQAPHHAPGNIYQEYPPSHLQKPTKLSIDIPPTEQAPTAASQFIKTIATTPKSDPSTNVYMNAEIGDPRKVLELDNAPKPAVVPVAAVAAVAVQQPRATLAQMESLDMDEPSSPDSIKAVYMNVGIGEELINNVAVATVAPAAEVKETQLPIATTPPVLANNLNSKLNDIKKDYTKNVVNGNVFGFTRALSFSQETTRGYENLEIGLSDMKPLMLRNRYSRPEIFSKVDLPLIDRTDKSEPCTPTQRKVNYIVLDLEQTTINNNNNNINNINNNSNTNNLGNKSMGNNNGSIDSCSDNQSQMVSSASASSGLLPPESPKKLGYATIDFDRSNALSNIINNPINDFDQSCRKTRHDSNAAPILMAMKHT